MMSTNFKNMVILMPLFLFACAGTKFKQVDYDNYWNITSFEPDGFDEITGTYLQSDEFSIEKIILMQDSTYYHSRYLDIYISDLPHAWKGIYSIHDDTLILVPQYNIYDSLFTNPKFERVEEISSQEIEQNKIANKKHGLYRVFKRIGDNVYLVRILHRDFWGRVCLENGGSPPMKNFKGKLYNEFFLQKQEPKAWVHLLEPIIFD